ncbi:MAG: ParB/RepB/Spo0J family partition protein [Minisyncoccia bacterium]
MPIGRGLSSLIPPKNNQQENYPPSNKPADVFRTGALGGEVSLVSGDSRTREPRAQGDADRWNRQTPGPARKISGGDSIFQIEVDKIKPNPYQPRHEFNDEGLEELAQSIREFGIIQPLVVSKVVKETETGTDVEYQLIAGERRLRAAKLAGLERVPAIVRKVDANKDKLEMALIENLQRHNLNPIEAAKAYFRLQDEFGLTQKEISVRVGKSRETVANTMRLLNLPSYIQEALIQNRLNESQARTFLGIQNMEEQRRVFENILSKGLSVRAMKSEVRRTMEPADPELAYWQKRLEEGLGMPIKIQKHGGKGRVAIEFYSDEEWHGVLEKLLGPELEQ